MIVRPAHFERLLKFLNKITVEGAPKKLRVGGVFRIGDPSSFAHAMANVYPLHIINRGNKIILTDKQAD